MTEIFAEDEIKRSSSFTDLFRFVATSVSSPSKSIEGRDVDDGETKKEHNSDTAAVVEEDNEEEEAQRLKMNVEAVKDALPSYLLYAVTHVHEKSLELPLHPGRGG
jgi:hypothetical protein